MRKIIQWVFGNFGNFLTLGGWLVSAGFFPALLHWGRGATPLGYGIAAVAGLIAFAFFRACWNVARVAKVTAVARERVMGESSAFDPMATVYENKRLFLRDLAPVGRKQVAGKTFRNCEIIGPGSAVLGLRSHDSRPFPIMRDSKTFDVDCVEIDPSKVSQLAILFPDCDFVGCEFYHMTLLFMGRENETLHWITKPSDQPQLPDMRTDDEKAS